MTSSHLDAVEKFLVKKNMEVAQPLVSLFDLKQEGALSARFPREEASLFRALSRARKVARYLIEESGSLTKERIQSILPVLDTAFDIKYVEGIFDRTALEHMIALLETLSKRPDLISMINSQKMPVANTHVQKILSRSIQEKKLTDAGIQRAILSALLIPLRQNVGSCFATAPCILIQREQVENFLRDVTTLISTGRISRVYDGVEFTVPMSLSGGVGMLKKRLPSTQHAPLLTFLGVSPHYKDRIERTFDEHLKKCQAGLHVKEALIDLTDHALLKSWEFTIASFSDFKAEVYKWNLYASLGFDQNEKGGVGDLIYSYLNTRLEESNEELQKIQSEYEHAYLGVKMTENLLRQADTPEKARRAKAEHASCVDHFYACQEKRDELHGSGEEYSKFFSFLMQAYASLLPKFFQEVYDADMVEGNALVFEDAPAGFRLLFKHGRSDPSAWTFISNERLFSESLEHFFRMGEQEVIEKCDWERGKKEIEGITTKLIYHVRTQEFIQSAFKRIDAFHTKHGIESGGFKTPWSYVSGGTLKQLLQCYYGYLKPFSEEVIEAYSPMELLTQYVDAFKAIPPRVTNAVKKNVQRRILATSPNHVFTLQLGRRDFVRAWDNKEFTYTWIRDNVLLPSRSFYQEIEVDSDTLEMIWLYMGGAPPRQGLQKRCSLREVVALFSERRQRIESLLRGFFPLVPVHAISDGPRWPHAHYPFMLARDIVGLDRLEEMGYTQPKALVVGDTNWSTYSFSFLVGPTSCEIELWRTDSEGVSGFPMREWSGIFSSPKRSWGVFFEISEYETRHITSLEDAMKKV